MDPTTTLITFRVQASSNTRSVQLVGSWDNFIRRYRMEKDPKRGRTEWRGCYSFKDITCDGDNTTVSKRNGGLKMGSKYYYYYELDGDSETYDSTLPFTTSCQYLPGQPVNFLWVPVEDTPLRERSASVGATGTDFRTMKPEHKYLTPQAPPVTVKALPRSNTSPDMTVGNRRTRSTSPARCPWYTRSLFGLGSPISSPPSDLDRRPLVSPLSGQECSAHIRHSTLVRSSMDALGTSFPAGPPSRVLSSSSANSSALGDTSPTSPLNMAARTIDLLSFKSASLNSSEEEFEEDNMNRKPHFSLDSITTTSISPTGSRYDSSSPSVYDSNDECIITDHSLDFDFTSTKPSANDGLGKEAQVNSFHGHNLPFGLDDVLHKHNYSHSASMNATVRAEEANTRTTSGPQVFQAVAQATFGTSSATTPDDLFTELRYLGDFISGNEKSQG